MKLISDKQEQLREAALTELKAANVVNENNLEVYVERLAQLELAIEDQGWERIGDQINKEFSRSGISMINDAARLFWLKNPLIRRAVLTQANYVFGQGINIASENENVNEVIQSFLDDTKNKAELTSHQNRMVKEIELQLFANIFFVFFVDKLTGAVKVRTIPEQEIKLIITDPDDKKTPWYYKRKYNVSEFDPETGSMGEAKQRTSYYKDWNLQKDELTLTNLKDAVIYHVSVNKLSDMQFGVSEVYAAMDWARAHKSFLEDWATITKSYAQFAWNMTAKNKTGMVRAKQKLGTTLSTDNTETNPPGATASILSHTEGTKMEPIKTAGATTKADDGDKLVHMVSAATGIFYHYLVGDPSTGNLATAKSMERPMELQFKNRQQLWIDVYTNILNFVVDQSIIASAGKLKGGREKIGEEINIVLAGEEKRLINVTFPDLLEKDTKERIEAILKASTLDGKQLAGTMELKVVARLVLEALGEKDIDDMIDEMFPDGQPAQQLTQVVTESFNELKEAIEKQNGNS